MRAFTGTSLACSVAALAIVSAPALAADPPTPGQIFQQQQQPGLPPRLPEVQTPPIEEKPDAGDFTTAPRARARRRPRLRQPAA